MRRVVLLAALLLAPVAVAQPVGQQGIAFVVAPTQFVYAGEASGGNVLEFSAPTFGVRYEGRGLTIEALYGRPTGKPGLAPLVPPTLSNETTLGVADGPRLTSWDVRAHAEQPFAITERLSVPVRLAISVRRVRSDDDVALVSGGTTVATRPEFSADALRLGGGLGWADRRERTRIWAMGLAGLSSRDFGSTGFAYGVEAGVRLAFPVRDQAVTAGYTFRLDGYDFGKLPLAGRETADAADYYGLHHALSVGLRF